MSDVIIEKWTKRKCDERMDIYANLDIYEYKKEIFSISIKMEAVGAQISLDWKEGERGSRSSLHTLRSMLVITCAMFLDWFRCNVSHANSSAFMLHTYCVTG